MNMSGSILKKEDDASIQSSQCIKNQKKTYLTKDLRKGLTQDFLKASQLGSLRDLLKANISVFKKALRRVFMMVSTLVLTRGLRLG
jgi:hypothetical protein